MTSSLSSGLGWIEKKIGSCSVVVLIKKKSSNNQQAPSDPCPTDLDRILTEGQDPDAQQYLVLGTVPIKGKNLGFWVPMHFLY